MKENKFLPVSKLFPNIMTLMGLCFGLTSIKYTFMAKWELATIFITFAAIIDGMDGKIARFLHSTSEFGAQLDSLADFLNFGVAPAFLLYFWKLKTIKVYGWVLVMIMVICMAIRLARFNTSVHEKKEDYTEDTFIMGVPAPVGALLSLIPLMLSFVGCPYFDFITIVEIMAYLLVVSILVVSRIPTFSLKNIKIPKNIVSLVMLFFGLLIVFLITKPWVTLTVLGTLYLISVPITGTIRLYLSRK
ncbi:MAG: phosphatidylcholine/phosphatidylserine synthase [Rickettsiaceae bacterium H1]|nr:phosphatidylcholine/phosphatidylserine synthase [Rickettsiaceae bacterium H1]